MLSSELMALGFNVANVLYENSLKLMPLLAHFFSFSPNDSLNMKKLIFKNPKLYLQSNYYKTTDYD